MYAFFDSHDYLSLDPRDDLRILRRQERKEIAETPINSLKAKHKSLISLRTQKQLSAKPEEQEIRTTVAKKNVFDEKELENRKYEIRIFFLWNSEKKCTF